jgi:hypothetical protein
MENFLDFYSSEAAVPVEPFFYSVCSHCAPPHPKPPSLDAVPNLAMGAIQSGGKNLSSKARTQNLMRSPSTSSFSGPLARGNPDGLSICFVLPENGTAVGKATSLRSSLLTGLAVICTSFPPLWIAPDI